jgi:osmotically-inducible protein OsmY
MAYAERRMATDIAPLRLGARICFQDRWQGRLSGFDLTEEWEVTNIVVSTGLFFSQSSVKLPFSAVKRFDSSAVYLDVISFTAFAREVPPVAAPARPMSAKTPIGHPGAKVAGVLVRTSDHRATDVLIESRGSTRRAPREQVAFDGPTLSLQQQLNTLPAYFDDDEILERVQDAVREDPVLPVDDKSTLVLDVDRGNVTVSGNVRARTTRDLVHAIVQRVAGVVSVRNQIADDLALETAIGLALARAGYTRASEVTARSNLGRVTLWGYAPSLRAIDDVVREVARVPGVRHVESHVELRAAVPVR